MKKIINKPSDVVSDMINGIINTHSNLCTINGYDVIARADYDSFKKLNKVALISGGGSGHEPAHAGYIGDGMLSAAVLGGVFASPSPQQVYQAICHVTGPAGCLLIVKNYTGDRLNFGIAQELARADGLQVEIVIVNDDVSIKEKKVRRGLAGTVLIHKIIGAYAEQGKSLLEVKELAEQVIQSIGTMGVGLGPCTLPGVEKPGFELKDNEIELGLGIHGEPGVKKTNLLPANELVDELLTYLMNDLSHLKESSNVGVMINGLGCTPLMELYITSQRVQKTLTDTYKLNVKRIMVGEYMTALDMPGFSITLLPLNSTILPLLDASTNAPGWKQTTTDRANPANVIVESTDKKPIETLNKDSTLYKSIKLICDLFINNVNVFTELDRKAGDGDMGISMERGAKAVLERLDEFPNDISNAIRSLALCLQQYTGGTSGVLYAIFFLKLSAHLENKDLSLLNWAEGIEKGTQSISELGGAIEGDCTMLDSLYPAVKAFKENCNKSLNEALKEASNAARKGSDKTIGMIPKRGRGQYLGERAKEERDGGAEAIALIFETLSKQF